MLGVQQVGENVTTAITFSPALDPGSFSATGLLTFAPNNLEIKIGDGTLDYTEKMAYLYDLDRGNLDQVREGNEEPMDVKIDAVYEHMTTGTGENVAPRDAVRGIGAASEWVSSSPDKCEPYCIDIVVIYTPPCSTIQTETTLLAMFRCESLAVNFKDAKIAVSGKCNTNQAVITRGAAPTGVTQPGRTGTVGD
jgi:hypothetical protein